MVILLGWLVVGAGMGPARWWWLLERSSPGIALVVAAEAFGPEDRAGAGPRIVVVVVPDGPAARAGLRRGDVITAIDGTPVDDLGHLRDLVASTAPRLGVRLTIVRDGKEQTVEVVLDRATRGQA